MHAGVWALSVLALAGVASCSTVDACTNEVCARKSTYIGLVAVEQLSTDDGIARREVVTVGAWADSGLGLGFKSSKSIAIPPSCVVVFIIRNTDQLAQAGELIKSTKERTGSDLCIVQE